jgi:glycosyltransferase involved in cell wall biosynthesis
MNVLLDARETRRMSEGMRAYVRELAARLPVVAPDITLYTIERGENFSFTEQVEIPFASRRADLVHFPTIFAPVVLPRAYVVTVHDLIHLRFPQLFSRTTGAYYTLFVRRLARGAARIAVGDERTRADCVEFLGVNAERVRIVPLGYEPSLLGIAPLVRPPYLIYVGNHRPHKNLATLINAWETLPDDIEVDLALTGEEDFKIPPRRSARRIVFLGNLDPKETAAAISGATALVQPSLAEGFGLPVLEAMVRGTPVIAAETAHPARFAPFVSRFRAQDTDALRFLLEEAIREPQRMRAQAAEGEAVAREYTWDRFAATMAGVYREALGDAP